ncbi:S9 family peptidase [Ornithobacterium rhinotracheale]|uniref:S9 family peptidase n=1 Tax=Ornithobacterium rhinotracheale TaxID=28251 RepID=UPI0039FDD6C5
MKRIFVTTLFSLFSLTMAQKQQLTPETLWQLGRVKSISLTPDNQNLIYQVSTPNMAENKIPTEYFSLNLKDKTSHKVSKEFAKSFDKKISPNGEFELFTKEVLVEKIEAKDIYPDLSKSTGYLYSDLQHRHWDTWNNGHFTHLFIRNLKTGEEIEMLKDEPYNIVEFTWNTDGSKAVYVSKKLYGKAYMTSTNTDVYAYDLKSQETENLTKGMMGYDTQPAFNEQGVMAWTSMATDGYEADKNDIFILAKGKKINLTKDWDGTVNSFIWNKKGDKIYFVAPTPGEEQVFEISDLYKKTKVTQLSKGMHNITHIVGEVGNQLIVEKTDINHAAEVFSFDLKSKKLSPLTQVNDAFYSQVTPSKVEQRWIKTTDNKEMLVNVIFPPNFDKNKKYPTLLYCQGGPQSPVNQFYSFRWNFALMAAEGYIVVAPNRRGLPGFGVKWNEDISGDWGGQAMRDYLSAIDALAKEPYVDNDRLGAVGASYGGYSVYYLAGIHKKRFKSFIAHCGVFDLRSMYGETEELFFVNHDVGGPYWEGHKSYTTFNPIEHVKDWDTPILIIHNDKDYRVPISQGLQAYTAARLMNIKSELLFFPDENHWVTQPQNGLFWQRTFFEWLKDTL